MLISLICASEQVVFFGPLPRAAKRIIWSSKGALAVNTGLRALRFRAVPEARGLYMDGIPHRLFNRGKVIAGGKLVPILGAVSMGLTTYVLVQNIGFMAHWLTKENFR